MSTTGLQVFLTASSGFLIGGLSILVFKSLLQKRLSFIFSFCFGTILSVVLLDILPEGIHLGGYFIIIVGVTLGVLFYLWLHKKKKYITIITADPKKDLLLFTGIILTLSIALHNIPTGILLGANTSSELSQSLLMTIFIHTIPEGIAVTAPLIVAGFGIFVLFMITLCVTIPIGLSTLLGQWIGVNSPQFLAILIAFSMGTLLAVSIKEIFGRAIKQASFIYCVIVSIFGFITIPILNYIFHRF